MGSATPTSTPPGAPAAGQPVAGSGPQGPSAQSPVAPAQRGPQDSPRPGASAPGQDGADAGPGAGADAGGKGAGAKSALADQAKDQAKERVPYADKVDQAKRVAGAAKEGGAGAGAEEAAAMAGAMAARAGATALTGGASEAAGAAAPQINKVIDKIGEKVGRLAFKGVAAVATATGALLLVLVIALTGGLSAVMDAVSGGQTAPPPTQDQCDSMPADWCDVLYEAQQTTKKQSIPTPWTVLAGVARVATDFGRTSPYDFVDRDPDRPTPPYLAANYAISDTAGANTLGNVPYNSGSLAWGGYENGKIPSDKLCDTLSGQKLECTAATALEQLNNAYKEDHGGASLGLSDAYRDFAGQQYQRTRWCAQGACSNAAKPGTSNHGWGKAVDFANFGSLSVYTDEDYVWMKANGPAFGWYHPDYMDEGGKGPHEPWHWEFRGGTGDQVSPASYSSGSTSTSVSAGVSASDDAGDCQVADPTTPIGAQGRQAAGPYLLLPAAATELDEEGGDPQNACDAAAFVAKRLSQTAADVAAELGRPAPGDDEGATTFWQRVVGEAGIIADPDQTSGDCLVVAGDGVGVDTLIEKIWKCEASAYDELFVVSSASVAQDGTVQFATVDSPSAVDTLISEAKAVAWGASAYGTATCDEAAATTGVFPLSAEQASSVGTVERCNVQENIRAAARLVLAGEAVAVASRSNEGGVFAPMIGGWAAIPAALGSDATTFPSTGPRMAWEASTACTAALDTYVVEHAGATSPFVALATATVRPDDAATYSNYLGAWPQGVSDACGAASDSDLASAAQALAQAHLTDVPGVVPARPGDTATPADEPEPAADVLPEVDHDAPADTEGDATTDPGTTPSVLSPVLVIPGAGGHGYSVPVADEAVATVDLQALAGLSAWFGWTQQEAAPGSAVYGEDSLVARLSTTGKFAAVGSLPTSEVAFAAAPWQSLVTDWATFYGGLVRPFDTFTTRTGSLVASLTGIAGQYAAVSGDASTQANTVIEAAKRYLGTPYAWGGGGPNGPSAGTTGVVGFDCSGLTEYAFAQAGYQIGGYTGVQKDVGSAVSSLADAQPGDLLLFGSPVHHVAIYLGNNQLIHAPKPGDVVKIATVYETPSVIRRVIVGRQTTGDLPTWISTALNVLYQNGFPKGQDDAAALNLIISKESSGNPQAVNKSDSNWLAGHPSFGLMQTIPTTFDAHALPGYTDKADPVSQIIAGARYAQSRYGGLDNVPGVKAVRAGSAYVGY